MFIALAFLAIVAGSLSVLGERRLAGRLIAAGVLLAIAAPLVVGAAGAFFQALGDHSGALIFLAGVGVLGAGAAVGLRRAGRPERLSLKKRLDHDN